MLVARKWMFLALLGLALAGTAQGDELTINVPGNTFYFSIGPIGAPMPCLTMSVLRERYYDIHTRAYVCYENQEGQIALGQVDSSKFVEAPAWGNGWYDFTFKWDLTNAKRILRGNAIAHVSVLQASGLHGWATLINQHQGDFEGNSGSIPNFFRAGWLRDRVSAENGYGLYQLDDVPPKPFPELKDMVFRNCPVSTPTPTPTPTPWKPVRPTPPGRTPTPTPAPSKPPSATATPVPSVGPRTTTEPASSPPGGLCTCDFAGYRDGKRQCAIFQNGIAIRLVADESDRGCLALCPNIIRPLSCAQSSPQYQMTAPSTTPAGRVQ